MVTLPVEMVRELKWRQGQKVEFRKKGKELIIKDWE
jgi:antitoxin component of MazEF toxin-antitoxin module